MCWDGAIYSTISSVLDCSKCDIAKAKTLITEHFITGESFAQLDPTFFNEPFGDHHGARRKRYGQKDFEKLAKRLFNNRVNTFNDDDLATERLSRAWVQVLLFHDPAHSPDKSLLGSRSQPHFEATRAPLESYSRTSELSRRATVYFSEKTAKELKIAAIEGGTNMSQIVEHLVADWLRKRSREQRK